MYSSYNIECLPDASGTSLPSPPAQERGLKQFETFLSQSSLQDMADRHESNNERLDNAPEDSNSITPLTRTGPLSTHSNTNPSGSLAISSNTTDSMWQEYQEREPKFVPPSTQACQRYRQSSHFHTNSALIHPPRSPLRFGKCSNVSPTYRHSLNHAMSFLCQTRHLFNVAPAKILIQAKDTACQWYF